MARMDDIYVVAFVLMWITSSAKSINVQQCHGELGMANGRIRNGQLSASSNEEHAGFARLHGERAWRAESNSDEWIQVDFQRQVHVSGITTQGVVVGHHVAGVTRYKVAHASEEDEWQYIMDADNEDEKIFDGNHDSSTPIYRAFHRAIRLRYLRIDITGCKHNRCALRFEVYGCELHPEQLTTPRQSIARTSSRFIHGVTRKAITETRLAPTLRRTTSSKARTTTKAPLATRSGRSSSSPGISTKTVVLTTVSWNDTDKTGNVSTTNGFSVFKNQAAANGARKGMKTGSVIGAVACAGVVLILLTVAGIWLYRRNKSSTGSKQVAVMQNIGPYEITTPGLGRTNSTDVLQSIDTYCDMTIPDPAHNDHDNAAYVITQIGINGTNTASSQKAGSSTAGGKVQNPGQRTSGWEENQIYAVNE